MAIKVLNLYSGLGGNRKLWEGVEVTAVEIVPQIANVYKKFFPDDQVITSDAHKFLLDHFEEFDFIWSSPPCQSHSNTNHFLFGQGVRRYPDMKLYEEILFLRTWSKARWVVENVVSYYNPLIRPKQIGRHYFWSNFPIPELKVEEAQIGTWNRQTASQFAQRRAIIKEAQIPELIGLQGFTFDMLKGLKNKRQILRNCVLPEIGLHIFKSAFKSRQASIFERFG